MQLWGWLARLKMGHFRRGKVYKSEKPGEAMNYEDENGSR